MNCPECGSENLNGAKYCRACGKPMGEKARTYRQEMPLQQGLGWHKFMIYVSLFAGAVLNFLNGIKAMTGMQYGELMEPIYMVFPNLKALDIVYGLCLIGISVFCVYTRFQLAKFKLGAPKLIAILYGCTVLLPVAYLGIADAITGINMMNESVIGSVIGSLAMAVINIIYYNKRSYMFIK